MHNPPNGSLLLAFLEKGKHAESKKVTIVILRATMGIITFEMRDTSLGLFILRIVAYWLLDWGSHVYRDYHIGAKPSLLGGQGDIVRRLITPITQVVTPAIPPKSP